MGTKAFLQKGRGKPGLVLPANAVERINQANDRSALVRAAAKPAEPASPPPTVAAKSAATMGSTATLTTEPEHPVETGTGAVPATMQQHPVEPDDPMAEAKDWMKAKVLGASDVALSTAEASPTVEVAPEPAAPAPEVDTAPDAKTEPDDLTKIAGIGPALSQRLHKFGFKNYGDLANASAAALDEIQGVKGRGASIIESARKLSGG